MSSKVSNKGNIYLTRGDSLQVKVDIVDTLGNLYSPVSSDVITFNLKKEATEDSPTLITKKIPYNTSVLHLIPEDTKALDFGEYRYEVSLTISSGDTYTFITNKKFVITEELG